MVWVFSNKQLHHMKSNGLLLENLLGPSNTLLKFACSCGTYYYYYFHFLFPWAKLSTRYTNLFPSLVTLGMSKGATFHEQSCQPLLDVGGVHKKLEWEWALIILCNDWQCPHPTWSKFLVEYYYRSLQQNINLGTRLTGNHNLNLSHIPTLVCFPMAPL